MKKYLLVTMITLINLSVFGQCIVNLTTTKNTICPGEKTTLIANSSEVKSIPNLSDTRKVFDMKDAKLSPDIINLIKMGALTGISYPMDTVKGVFNLSLPGIQLKNALISSGKLTISLETDLKQDMTVYVELPYFKVNGLSLKDSIIINGSSVQNTTGMSTFSKVIDITNASADFTSGNPTLYNTITYKVKPKMKITTRILTGTEIGNLKMDLKDLILTENTTYSWQFNNTLLQGKNTPNIEVTEPGTYKVTSVSNCGTAENTLVISKAVTPSNKINVIGNLTFCEGDSVKLSADGIGTYTWSNNKTTNEIVVTTPGTFSLNIKNDYCTVSSDPIVVNVIPKPSTKVNVFGNLNLCEGESVKLSAEGIGTYTWSNNETSKEIVVTKSGSYSLNIKNNFCSVNSTPIVVNMIAKPSNNISVYGNLTLCEGESVTLSADGIGSYMWSNAKTTKEIVVSEAGTYSLNIKNDYCNVNSTPIVVNVIAKPSNKVNVSGNLTFCQGDSVKLSADGMGSYMWTNGKTSKEIVVKDAGTYTLNIKNDYCNVNSSPIVVSVNSKPSNKVNVSGNLTFCEGDSIILDAVGEGTYKWSNGSSNKSIIVKEPGKYTVTITKYFCSAVSDIIVANTNPKPILKFNYKDTTINNGEKLTLKVSGAKEYLWNDQSKLDSVVIKDAGKYTVIGKNDLGCKNTASFELKFSGKEVGINKVNELYLSISPNPVSEILTVSLENYKNNSLTILDLKGNQILTQPLVDYKTEINVNSFAKGIYLVSISDNTNTVLNTKRFVVE